MSFYYAHALERLGVEAVSEFAEALFERVDVVNRAAGRERLGGFGPVVDRVVRAEAPVGVLHDELQPA